MPLEKYPENLKYLLTLKHDPNTIRLANCYTSEGNFDANLLVKATPVVECGKKKKETKVITKRKNKGMT